MTDIQTQGETEARDKAWELVNEFIAGCCDLSAFQLAHAHRLVTSVGDALLSLSQERDRLREALEPFAAIPPADVGTAKHYWCVIGNPCMSHFTREDLASARAALQKEPS